MGELSRIRLHPVKGLDPIEVEETPIEGGGLKYDRRYAIFDSDGEYINGREDARIQRLRSTFDTDADELALRREDDAEAEAVSFHVERERAGLEAWLSDYFDEAVTVEECTGTRFTDYAGELDPHKITSPGPSVVSTETYREVASWFPDIGVEEVRARFRTNLEVDGVPAFWEDRLFADAEHVVGFSVGDVTVHGTMPVPRCVVPTRNPWTAEQTEGFVGEFTERRAERFPEWAAEEHLGEHINDRGDHAFYLTVVTRIPESEEGKTVSVGDEIEVAGELPLA